MKKTLIAAAVTVESSHAAQQFLLSLSKLKGDFDVLLVDYSSRPVYAEWLSKAQKIFPVKVMRQEFGAHVELFKKREECHNLIRDYCIKKKYDSLLLVEHDVILAPHALETLKKSKKEVISGVAYGLFLIQQEIMRLPTLYGEYSQKHQDHLLSHKDELRTRNPKLYASLEEHEWDFSKVKRPLLNDEVEKGKGIIPIKFAQFDCLLISAKVLSEIKFDSKNGSKSDDVIFFQDLRAKNIPAFADTDVQCGRRVVKKLFEHAEKLKQNPLNAS